MAEVKPTPHGDEPCQIREHMFPGSDGDRGFDNPATWAAHELLAVAPHAWLGWYVDMSDVVRLRVDAQADDYRALINEFDRRGVENALFGLQLSPTTQTLEQRQYWVNHQMTASGIWPEGMMSLSWSALYDATVVEWDEQVPLNDIEFPIRGKCLVFTHELTMSIPD